MGVTTSRTVRLERRSGAGYIHAGESNLRRRRPASPQRSTLSGGAVERDARETGGTTVSRGQNVVYVMPHDWASIAHFLGPALDRVDDASGDLQLLVITSDAELAAAVAAAAVRILGDRTIDVLAATTSARAARLLHQRPAQVIAGPASVLVELLRGSALKLEGLRAITIAWADELTSPQHATALETLMAELPKESPRTIVTAEVTPGVEELIERYARRARRVLAPANEADQPARIEYVSASALSRLAALRRLLDELNPTSALVFARDDSEAPIRDLLRSLGYRASDAAIRVGRVADPATEVVILFDLPASREELREVMGVSAKRVVALAQPRQIASLRVLAAGGTVVPITLSDATQRARAQDAGERAELREVLDTGQFGRELLALEPLLDEFDGIEIAAAALQLLERERNVHAANLARAASAGAGAGARMTTGAAASGGGASGAMTRLFVNVGSRDNVRPGDLMGAIANQAGISSADVGKIDLRESHAVVEVSSAVADKVIETLTGTMIRGRRAIARRDEERPARSAAPRGDRGDRGDRGARGSGDRPPRRDRTDRDNKDSRSDRGAPRPRERSARPPRRRGDE